MKIKTQRFEQRRQRFSGPAQRGQQFRPGALEILASLPLPLQRFEFFAEAIGRDWIASQIPHDLAACMAKPQLED